MKVWADMTPGERQAAAQAACKKLEAELTASAEAIGATLDEFSSEVRNSRRKAHEQRDREARLMSS